MKRFISLFLTLMLVLSMGVLSFAEETTSPKEDTKKIEPKDEKIEFYFINNKIYIQVTDAMRLLDYEKKNENTYEKNQNVVEFSPANMTISFEGMPKNIGNDLQSYSGKLVISANAIEELFSKSLLTTGNTAKFMLTNSPTKIAQDWTENRMIAHAMGAVNGMVKTNTLDAMKESYKKGYKVFEVDLLSTSDGKLVASPGFYEYLAFKYGKPIPVDKQGIIPTKDEFMSFTPNGILQPIDLESIVKIMSANKDMYLVTDTKATDFVQAQNQFKEIVSVSKAIDPTVLDRIIPQIYNEQMYDAVKSQHNFKSIIYTLYSTTSSNAEALQFATAKGIKVITMAPERINPVDMATYNSYGIKVYTHTINTLEDVKKYKDMGVYGFYSDFVTPAQLDTLN